MHLAPVNFKHNFVSLNYHTQRVIECWLWEDTQVKQSDGKIIQDQRYDLVKAYRLIIVLEMFFGAV